MFVTTFYFWLSTIVGSSVRLLQGKLALLHQPLNYIYYLPAKFVTTPKFSLSTIVRGLGATVLIVVDLVRNLALALATKDF